MLNLQRTESWELCLTCLQKYGHTLKVPKLVMNHANASYNFIILSDTWIYTILVYTPWYKPYENDWDTGGMKQEGLVPREVMYTRHWPRRRTRASDGRMACTSIWSINLMGQAILFQPIWKCSTLWKTSTPRPGPPETLSTKKWPCPSWRVSIQILSCPSGRSEGVTQAQAGIWQGVYTSMV